VTDDYYGQPHPDTVPVVFAPDVISVKGRLEHGISFTPDTKEMAFGVLHKDYSGHIQYAKKIANTWTAPSLFEPLASEMVFLPYFTPDGKNLLYAQGNSVTNDSYRTNLYALEKVNGAWKKPTKLKAPIHSESREANASMTLDGTIYFSSNRNCEGKENCFTADLFSSKQVDNEYQTVQEVTGLNSDNDEESVFVSPNEEYLILCRYTDNTSFADLYISYRNKVGLWSTPRVLNASVNSKDWDRRPFVSFDNRFLFFTRLTITGQDIIESDIYWVNTSKVFTPFVYNAPADVSVKIGEPFKIAIPPDYFKDINDKALRIAIHQDAYHWLQFDDKKMILSGLPTQKGDFKVIFTATDASLNATEHALIITVIE